MDNKKCIHPCFTIRAENVFRKCRIISPTLDFRLASLKLSEFHSSIQLLNQLKNFHNRIIINAYGILCYELTRFM